VGIDTLSQANQRLIVVPGGEASATGNLLIHGFAGGLVVYGVHYPDHYRRAASFADRIFKGANPADLPVEQPTKFELVVNLKAAQTLGITIPQSILMQVDRVLE
jgi:putative ABC transport system substrate-binding protein